MDGRPEPVQRREMLRHAVAHVALEAVARMRGAEPLHQPVARDLGDDRGRRDREHQRVAGDHRLAVAAAVDLVAAVDEHELRPHRQRLHRARQRPQRGAQDVVAVDARGRAEGDRDLGAGADLLVELLALLAVELLGIVEPARNALRDRGSRRRRPPDRRAARARPRRSPRPARRRASAPRARGGTSGGRSASPDGRRATLRGGWRDFMPRDPARARRSSQSRPGSACEWRGKLASVGRISRPSAVNVEARRLHDLPEMAVRIGEIAAIAAVVGLSRACAAAWRPAAMACANAASTSSGVAQFQASVAPRNAGGRVRPAMPASSASLSQCHSASTTPPASKNAISSPVARTFRSKPSAS